MWGPAVDSLQEDRRGQRTGHSFCPRGASKLRGSSNNTSEATRKQTEEKSKYSVEWTCSFEEHTGASRPSGVRGASEDAQDSEAK